LIGLHNHLEGVRHLSERLRASAEPGVVPCRWVTGREVAHLGQRRSKFLDHLIYIVSRGLEDEPCIRHETLWGLFSLNGVMRRKPKRPWTGGDTYELRVMVWR
jgi:hypothetical protein